MLTFSQCIDDIIAEVIRPDMDVALATYLNGTIRELHFTSDLANPLPVGYSSNLIEESLEADSDSGFTWSIPRPARFQMMEAVFYHSVHKYATMRRPSSMRQFESSVDGAQYSYYRTGNDFAFSNYGAKFDTIDIAYFEYLPPLAWYPDPSTRPVEWDAESESWRYHTDYDGSEVLRTRARELCTNWMIERWRDLVLAGVRAKIWARLSDEVRMRTAYSNYQGMRGQIIAAETYTLSPRYRG